MPIHKRFEFKAARQVQAGELISIDLHDEPVKAIALNMNEEELSLTLLVLVPAHGKPFPYRTSVGATGYALSFGTNWVLDLGDAGGQAPDKAVSRDIYGVVQVTPDTVCMRAAQDSDQTGGRCLIDMATFRGVGTMPQPSRTVDVLEWKLWLSDEDRTSHRGVPFIDFKAKKPAVPL